MELKIKTEVDMNEAEVKNSLSPTLKATTRDGSTQIELEGFLRYLHDRENCGLKDGFVPIKSIKSVAIDFYWYHWHIDTDVCNVTTWINPDDNKYISLMVLVKPNAGAEILKSEGDFALKNFSTAFSNFTFNYHYINDPYVPLVQLRLNTFSITHFEDELWS